MDFEALITYLAGAGIVGLSAWVLTIQAKIHAVELKVTESYMHKDTGDKIFTLLDQMKNTLTDLDKKVSVMADRNDRKDRGRNAGGS